MVIQLAKIRCYKHIILLYDRDYDWFVVYDIIYGLYVLMMY